MVLICTLLNMYKCFYFERESKNTEQFLGKFLAICSITVTGSQFLCGDSDYVWDSVCANRGIIVILCFGQCMC